MKKSCVNKLSLGFFFVILSLGFASAAACTSTITACCDLASSGTYTLTQSFSSIGTCFNTYANNVVLDGNGYTITGPSGSYGILNTGWITNVTVKNLRFVSYSTGIYFNLVNDSQMINNTIINSTSSGIYLSSAYRNNIAANTISSRAGGGGGDHAVELASNCVNNTIRDNTFNNNVFAISFQSGATGTTGNQVINNTLNSNDNAISIYSSGNNFINNSADSSAQSAIYMGTGASSNNFSNMVITNTAGAAKDVFFSSGAGNGTYFIDVFPAKYSFSGNLVYFKNTGKGEIKFLQGLTGTGTTLTSDLQINDNYVYINSAVSSLNKSANVTLYGVPAFTNATIFRDGSPCPASICTAYTPLTGDVIFGVTGWSNYTIGDGGGSSPGVPEFSTYAIIAAITIAIASIFFIRSRQN